VSLSGKKVADALNRGLAEQAQWLAHGPRASKRGV
jgi:hypothetical protein